MTDPYQMDSPRVQEFDGIPYVSLGPFEVVVSGSSYVEAAPVYCRQPDYKHGQIWPCFTSEGSSAEEAVEKCKEQVATTQGRDFNKTRKGILDLLCNAVLQHYTLVGPDNDRTFTCCITTRF